MAVKAAEAKFVMSHYAAGRDVKPTASAIAKSIASEVKTRLARPSHDARPESTREPALRARSPV